MRPTDADTNIDIERNVVLCTCGRDATMAAQPEESLPALCDECWGSWAAYIAITKIVGIITRPEE